MSEHDVYIYIYIYIYHAVLRRFVEWTLTRLRTAGSFAAMVTSLSLVDRRSSVACFNLERTLSHVE